VWVGRHVQPGGAGAPAGVPIVDVFNEALASDALITVLVDIMSLIGTKRPGVVRRKVESALLSALLGPGRNI